MNKFKKVIIDCIAFSMKIIRPFLGYPVVCIYPVNCMTYAESMLLSHSWYYAIPAIFFRVLSCNPITGMLLLRRNSCSLHEEKSIN